jgi:hypothetical protein
MWGLVTVEGLVSSLQHHTLIEFREGRFHVIKNRVRIGGRLQNGVLADGNRLH